MLTRSKKKILKATTLIQGIYNYNVLRNYKILSPSELQINITYHCNSRCLMCNIWKMKPKNELAYGKWQKIMSDPIFSTINRLMIAGGEPTLHPELIKLVKLFVDSMPKLKFLSIVTNGFSPQTPAILEKAFSAIKSKADLHLSITVSIDGVGEMHETMRRVPKAFEKVKNTVMTLKALQEKYDFWLGVSCVISRKNLYGVKEVEKWCQTCKIPFNYQLVGFHKAYVQNMETKNELDFQNEDKKYLYRILQGLSSPRYLQDVMSYYWNDMLHMYKNNTLRTTPCPFVSDAFAIDSLGDVYYCLSERKIGNCRKDGNVGKIYYDPKNIAFRKKIAETICLKCNSACNVRSALRNNFLKYIWFYLTGRRGPVGVY